MLNEKVKHIALGEGTIVESVKDGKIYVKFNGSDDNKAFKYPEAFEHFLEFKDLELQKKAELDIEEKHKSDLLKKEESRAEFERKFEENLKEKLILEKSARKQTKRKSTAKK